MNEHILSFHNGIGLTGIYRNRYGSQQIMLKYKNNKGIVWEQHLTTNRFNFSKWKPVKSLTQIDPTIMNDLLNDGYEFDYEGGVAIG